MEAFEFPWRQCIYLHVAVFLWVIDVITVFTILTLSQLAAELITYLQC